MKQIISSLAVIMFVGALIAGGTGAFFFDSETSTGNLFTAGAIDLSIGSEYSSLNGVNTVDDGQQEFLADNDGRALFAFEDLKPGDQGTVVFNLKVSTNDAYACAVTELMTGNENTLLDPEVDEGDDVSDGELQNYIQFATFADLNLDGLYNPGVEPVNVNQYGGDSNGFTNAQIAGAGSVPVADTTSPNTWLTVSQLAAEDEYGAGMLYCFGDFETTGLLDATEVTGCDGSASIYNDAQSDSAIGSITFSAVQTRNNEGFTCQPAV